MIILVVKSFGYLIAIYVCVVLFRFSEADLSDYDQLSEIGNEIEYEEDYKIVIINETPNLDEDDVGFNEQMPIPIFNAERVRFFKPCFNVAFLGWNHLVKSFHGSFKFVFAFECQKCLFQVLHFSFPRSDDEFVRRNWTMRKKLEHISSRFCGVNYLLLEENEIELRKKYQSIINLHKLLHKLIL